MQGSGQHCPSGLELVLGAAVAVREVGTWVQAHTRALPLSSSSDPDGCGRWCRRARPHGRLVALWSPATVHAVRGSDPRRAHLLHDSLHSAW